MPHSPEKKALSLEVSKLQSHYEESFESPSLKPEATKKNSLDQNKSELAAVEIEREAHNAPPSLKDVIKSLLMWQKTTHEHLKQENLN